MEQLAKRQAADTQRAHEIFAAFRANLRDSLDRLRSQGSRSRGQLLADDQQRQWRRDIEAMQRRLDELDDEEAREIAAITDRYADVKPHTTAAAVVFALTRDDADGGLQLMARPHTTAPLNCQCVRAASRVARTRRHRRPVPGDRAAEAGLAARHAQPRPTTARTHCITRARTSRPPGRRSTAHRPTMRAVDAYRVARDKWVETVLRDVAGWAESLSWGQVPGVQAQSPNRAVTVTAQAALIGTGRRIGALVHRGRSGRLAARRHPTTCGPRRRSTGWKRCCARTAFRSASSPTAAGGGWCAPATGAMAASGIVDALTWIEEPRTRDAFLTLSSAASTSSAATRPSGCRCCSRSRSPPPRRSPKPSAPRSAARSSC